MFNIASNLKISLDTNKENYNPLKCKQNDDITLEATIYENGIAKDLSNATILIQAKKADNTYIIQSTDLSKSNNIITSNLIKDFTRVSGPTIVEIVLKESSKQNTTFSFYLEVVGSVIKGAVESNNTVTILENLQERVVEAEFVKEQTEELIQNGGAATKGDIAIVNSHLEQNEKQYIKCSKTLKKMLYGESVTIIAFGDSITFGREPGANNVQVPSQYPYPAVLQGHLRAIFNNNNITVTNKGVSGNTSTLLLNRIDTDVIALNPDCCIVMTGYNDVGTNMNPSDFKSNMESISQKLKKSNIETILMATVPNFNDGYNKKIADFNAITEETSKKHSLAFVDMFKATMERYSTGAYTPLIAQPDNVHFEASHCRFMAEEIVNSVFGFLDLSHYLKSNQKLHIPVVNSPFVVSNLSSKVWKNNKIRTGQSFYLSPSTSDFLNFPFIIKQRNVSLKIDVQKAFNGGNIDIYDNGVLLKNVSCKSVGVTEGGIIDCENILIENLSLGYHCIQLKSSSVLVGSVYVSEFIFEVNNKENDTRIDYALSSTSPQLTFIEMKKIFDNRVRFKNLSAQGNGTLNRESKSLELISGKTLVMEFLIKTTAGIGISWFGNKLNYNSAPTYQLGNMGYLLYFTSSSEVRILKSNFTGATTGITPYTTGLTLDFTKDILVKIEHSSLGNVNVYINDILIKNFTDTDYNVGYCGLYGQVADATIDVKESYYYYV